MNVYNNHDFDYTESGDIVNDSFLESVSEYLQNNTFKSFSEAIKKQVIGQEEIDIILANIYNYLMNISSKRPVNNNMLLAAPSGSGKTETYRAVKRYFADKLPELPIAQVDVTAITEEGIVGAQTELLVAPLLESDLNGYGIIFMDEFDKKLMPSIASGSNMNAAVQNQLLTIIEGREVEEIRDGYTTGYSIDTNNTMFIGLGSFNYCREQRKEEKRIGFESNLIPNHFEDITRESMIKMGASYELIGRFPLIVNYHKLDEKSINKIIDMQIKNVSHTIGYDIIASKKMRQQLFDCANSEYGCRLIESHIRSTIMSSYIMLLKHRTKNCFIQMQELNKSVIVKKVKGKTR